MFRIRKHAVMLLCLTMLLSAAGLAAEPRTVRVGYFAFPGYHDAYQDENGLCGSGYGFDFLQLLRRYTNLNCRYISCDNSWQEAQEMLRCGEVDIVTSARKTPQREAEFAFSSPIGISHAELCVRQEDGRFQLNDYGGFDGMTIGVLKGNSRNGDLAVLAAEKGFTYRTVEYDEETELTAALHNGEVDGIVASNLRKHADERIVARFALEEFYAIVRKEDTELLEEINRGIEQMDLHEGDWKNRLYCKYTAGSLESTLSFTPEEQAYIRAVQSGEKVITACAQPDRDPYSYVEDGELTGIIPEYFAYLMRMAGLPYSVMVAQSREQYYDWAMNNAVDVYMDMSTDRSNLLQDDSGVFTDPYIELTTSRITKKDFQGTIHTVAVAYHQLYDGIDIDLAEDVRVIHYATRSEAMQAVRDGTADACYVYTYMAEKFINQDPDRELIYHIVNRPAFGLAICIRPTTDHALISILNKCLKADQSHMLDELTETYTRYEQGRMKLAQVVRRYPGILAAVITALLCAGTVTILTLQNNRKIRAIAEERRALAASLKEKNRLLEESAQQAQSANVAKTTFLNNMSHDIRTPMNAIIGFTNIALRQNPGPEVQDCLRKIGDSSEHLLTLINDVLDISRIESGKIRYTPTPVDITTMTDAVLEITRGFLIGRDITFNVRRAEPEHPFVLADAVRIREVLVNILSNAVKFTGDGGTICFETDCLPGEDDRHIVVRYRITDNGVGMSEAFLARIFDEFAQEDNGARTQYKGTGLGMAITRRYVEMMGGSITVESQKGVGSAFTVELPMALTDAQAVSHQELPHAGQSLRGVRVLMAEDNDLNAEIAQIQLEDVGMKVTRAADGQQAVEIFAEKGDGAFDLILMDIMMPRMNGYEATHAIRSMAGRPDGRTIPIIAMTANAFAEDVQQSMDAGMDGHLSKPIVMDEVIRTIAMNLKRTTA